jgi:hypothetical protein
MVERAAVVADRLFPSRLLAELVVLLLAETAVAEQVAQRLEQLAPTERSDRGAAVVPALTQALAAPVAMVEQLAVAVAVVPAQLHPARAATVGPALSVSTPGDNKQ